MSELKCVDCGAIGPCIKTTNNDRVVGLCENCWQSAGIPELVRRWDERKAKRDQVDLARENLLIWLTVAFVIAFLLSAIALWKIT